LFETTASLTVIAGTKHFSSNNKNFLQGQKTKPYSFNSPEELIDFTMPPILYKIL
jgi:hypothetical protein